jgi:pseudouridine-5'-phosphate glycosidase
MPDWLHIAPRLGDAARAPVVALESTVIAHGLPYPHNVRTALRLEQIVTDAGALPATIGILRGVVTVGLSPDEVEYIGRAPAGSAPAGSGPADSGPAGSGPAGSGPDIRKVSRRDLPIVMARGLDGATTVASTAWAAHQAGVRVFATGGIGGVHRGHPFDVSADLPELAQTPVIVVCAGAKAILDLPLTLEWLETHGVTVAGYRTDTFPAFYNRDSGLPVDIRVESPEEVAALYRAQRALGLPAGLLVTVPIPEADELPAARMEEAIAQALAEAEAAGVKGKTLTPFLLSRISELTGEASLRANLALLENNARVAAEIALALAD